LPGGTLQSVVRRVQRVIAQRKGEAPAEPRGRIGARWGTGSAGTSRSQTLTGQLLLEVVDETIEAKGEVKPAATEQRTMLAQLSWPATVAWIGARLADGLEYAHSRGVLRRDIKPAIVLLSTERSPKLADFNISFAGGAAGQSPQASAGCSVASPSTAQREGGPPGRPRRPDAPAGRGDLHPRGAMASERPTRERASQGGTLAGGSTECAEELLNRRRH